MAKSDMTLVHYIEKIFKRIIVVKGIGSGQ